VIDVDDSPKKESIKIEFIIFKAAKKNTIYCFEFNLKILISAFVKTFFKNDTFLLLNINYCY